MSHAAYMELDGAVFASGVGVHSGEVTHLKITSDHVSASHDFVCSDESLSRAKGAVPVNYSMVQNNTPGHTVLRRWDGVGIATVEHLLAAISGLHIAHTYVMFHGKEVPIFDGSALPWVQLFKPLLKKFDAPRTHLRVLKTVKVEAPNGAWCELTPCAYDYRLHYILDYDHPMIGKQEAEYIASATNFEREIAPARTFGFYHDAVHLRLQNRALGAGLHNTVVFSEDGVLNPEGLRFPDEPARHKLLDAMGDLACAGDPILGAFRGYKSGHDLNAKLLQALFADPSNYSFELKR